MFYIKVAWNNNLKWDGCIIGFFYLREAACTPVAYLQSLDQKIISGGLSHKNYPGLQPWQHVWQRKIEKVVLLS